MPLSRLLALMQGLQGAPSGNADYLSATYPQSADRSASSAASTTPTWRELETVKERMMSTLKR